jgi:hypothetical protein
MTSWKCRVDLVRFAGHDFSNRAELSGLERLGFARKRCVSYTQHLRELGLAQITKGGGTVEFRVDTGSLSNGDSYKGYEYSSTPPVGSRKVRLGLARGASGGTAAGSEITRRPPALEWAVDGGVGARSKRGTAAGGEVKRRSPAPWSGQLMLGLARGASGGTAAGSEITRRPPAPGPWFQIGGSGGTAAGSEGTGRSPGPRPLVSDVCKI